MAGMGYFRAERFDAIEARLKRIEDQIGITAADEHRARGGWARHRHGTDEPHSHHGIHNPSEHFELLAEDD